MKLPKLFLPLAATIAMASCVVQDEVKTQSLIRVSNNHPICIDLGEGVIKNQEVEDAYDFEVTDIDENKLNGNVYVGYFPDFPGINFDDKYYEPQNAVVFSGRSSQDGIEKLLFRFGLDEEPSIYVLLSFWQSPRLPKAFEASPDGIVQPCHVKR